MEMILVFLVGLLAVVAIPVMVIVALVTSAGTRRLMEDRLRGQMDRIRDLEGQLGALRRVFTEWKRRPEHVASAPQEVARTVREPAPEVSSAASEILKPAIIPIPPSVIVPPLPAAAAAQVSAKVPLEEPATPEPAAFVPSPVFTAAPASTPVNAESPVKEPVSVPAIREAAPPRTSVLPKPAYAYTPAPPRFVAPRASGPPRKSLSERLRASLPLEEWLGMNLFAKIGIVLLVLGFALLGHMALVKMGPAARDALILAVSGAMLGGGIWL